jgi:hypothetical protein
MQQSMPIRQALSPVHRSIQSLRSHFVAYRNSLDRQDIFRQSGRYPPGRLVAAPATACDGSFTKHRFQKQPAASCYRVTLIAHTSASFRTKRRRTGLPSIADISELPFQVTERSNSSPKITSASSSE